MLTFVTRLGSFFFRLFFHFEKIVLILNLHFVFFEVLSKLSFIEKHQFKKINIFSVCCIKFFIKSVKNLEQFDLDFQILKISFVRKMKPKMGFQNHFVLPNFLKLVIFKLFGIPIKATGVSI